MCDGFAFGVLPSLSSQVHTTNTISDIFLVFPAATGGHYPAFLSMYDVRPLNCWYGASSSYLLITSHSVLRSSSSSYCPLVPSPRNITRHLLDTETIKRQKTTTGSPRPRPRLELGVPPSRMLRAVILLPSFDLDLSPLLFPSPIGPKVH